MLYEDTGDTNQSSEWTYSITYDNDVDYMYPNSCTVIIKVFSFLDSSTKEYHLPWINCGSIKRASQLKNAFPKLEDAQLYGLIEEILDDHNDDDKNTQAWRNRVLQLRLLCFTCLYRKYGSAFVLQNNEPRAMDDRD
jgi:hypothetical protein